MSVYIYIYLYLEGMLEKFPHKPFRQLVGQSLPSDSLLCWWFVGNGGIDP